MNEMTRIAAAPESFKARFTTAEFLRMCDSDAFEDWKVELIDGELERMPPPNRMHSFMQTTIVGKLLALLGPERVCVEIGVDLGHDTVVGADVALLHVPMAEARWLRADEVVLAVEVAETTVTRDTVMKLAKYARAGVPHYWVVDRARSITHVYAEPLDGDYARFDTVRFGEPLAVPGTDATITLS